MTREDGDRVSSGATDGPVTAGARVLVVDDEASVRESFERALAAADYDVVTAKNGGEALAELEPAVDVVLLDRRMPGMSGDDVLEHIQEWRTNCRVVLVTAVDPDVDVVDMAFDDYITKPVRPPELIETIEQLLLFDRYETLLSEYHAKTRKATTLESAFDGDADEENEAIAAIKEARDEVRAELEATIAEFSDEGVRRALRDAHGELS